MNARGGALVETAIAAGLAAFLLSASLGIGRLALDRRRAVAVARYGTELSAAGLPPASVDAEMGSYAGALGLTGGTVSAARFTALPSAAFYRFTAAETRVSSARTSFGNVRSWTDRFVLQEE